jgi:hypothetical protein
MDAVILLNKPSGVTSFDAVRKCRRICNEKKIGHTGTLDPEASGLMVILLGRYTDEIVSQASEAGFDEIYTLIGLMLSNVRTDIRRCRTEDMVIDELRTYLKKYAEEDHGTLTPQESLSEIADSVRRKLDAGKKSGSIDIMSRRVLTKTAHILEKFAAETAGIRDYSESFDLIRDRFSDMVKAHASSVSSAQEKLTGLFRFAEKCWGEGREMLMIVTELTADADSASFINKYGCDEYFRHNKELLFSERQLEIDRKIGHLDL